MYAIAAISDFYFGTPCASAQQKGRWHLPPPRNQLIDRQMLTELNLRRRRTGLSSIVIVVGGK